MGEVYLRSIMDKCRLDEGYTSLQSVITGQKGDKMHSFFLAETLKYLYLLFKDESVIDFNSIIFNTEAHPLKKVLSKYYAGADKSNDRYNKAIK